MHAMSAKSYAKVLYLLYKAVKQGLSSSSSSCQCRGWENKLLFPFQVSQLLLIWRIQNKYILKSIWFCRAWFDYLNKYFYEIKCIWKLSRTVARAESCPVSEEERSCCGEEGSGAPSRDGDKPPPCVREAWQQAMQGALQLAGDSSLHAGFLLVLEYTSRLLGPFYIYSVTPRMLYGLWLHLIESEPIPDTDSCTLLSEQSQVFAIVLRFLSPPSFLEAHGKDSRYGPILCHWKCVES